MTLPIHAIDALIATRPELQQFTADEWELAYALAGCFQQPNPTAEQCADFVDDAQYCATDVGPGPYTVTKLGETTGNYTAVVMVNGWLCGAEEGEGHILLTTIADLRDWTISNYEPCQTARGWGECVLANGHETRPSQHVGGTPVTAHLDRHGLSWGVASTGASS